MMQSSDSVPASSLPISSQEFLLNPLDSSCGTTQPSQNPFLFSYGVGSYFDNSFNSGSQRDRPNNNFRMTIVNDEELKYGRRETLGQRRHSLPSNLNFENIQIIGTQEKSEGANFIKENIEKEKELQERKIAKAQFPKMVVISIVLSLFGLFFLSCLPFIRLLKYANKKDKKTQRVGRYAWIAFLITLVVNIVFSIVIVSLEVAAISVGASKK